LQGITRNDLADPGIIGINAGAGVGVAVFFLFFPIEVGTFVYLIPVVAFISALFTAVLIYLFSYKTTSGIEPIRFVLVGVGFSFFIEEKVRNRTNSFSISRSRFFFSFFRVNDYIDFFRRKNESRFYCTMARRKCLGNRLAFYLCFITVAYCLNPIYVL